MLTKAQQKPHSRLGSISFVLGILSVVGSCCAMVALPAAVVTSVLPSSVPVVNLGWTTVCALVGAPFNLLGLGCGIAGFFERDKDRVPNILGIVLCVIAVVILAIGALTGHVITAPLGPRQPNL